VDDFLDTARAAGIAVLRTALDLRATQHARLSGQRPLRCGAPIGDVDGPLLVPLLRLHRRIQ
jgi:hypothetical protein